MSSERRVQQQPAFLLHYRPFRDSSLLLDVVSRDHGRLTLVARGARSAKSRLRGVLRPFMPLQMSWFLRADLGTLTGAELAGQPLTLLGDSLLSGYYINELLLHFLHRHDPQPEVFAVYEQTVATLASTDRPAPVLRYFEIELLKLLGYGPVFEHDAIDNSDIQPECFYEYRPEQGAVRVQRDSGPMVFPGSSLIGIRENRFEDATILSAANRLLRNVVSFHLGGRELKSRKVLLDLHRGRDRMASPAAGSGTDKDWKERDDD